jgi:DtxR family transcriptional regulator, Mn-dependent transcriptional regulator
MQQALSPALENYLEAIYVLQKVKDTVKVIDIANYLNVKMPSVTYNMIKLASKGLITYEKRSHVELTGEGERAACSVLRTHEELFNFFNGILGVSRRAAEEDACRAEHTLSRETVDRLVQFTQWVAALPEEISFRPLRAYAPEPAEGVRLADIPVGGLARINKITASGNLRKRLMEMGLNKGAEVCVVRKAPLGDPIEIKLKGFHLSLRNSEAAKIEVEPLVPARR